MHAIKFVAVLASGALLMGLVLIGRGMLGPLYPVEPARVTVDLQTPSIHEVEFVVGRTETYMVEIHLRRAFADEKMNSILGRYVSRGGGLLSVEWEITESGKPIAAGSSEEQGYSPIFGHGRYGLLLGQVPAETGRLYKLMVRTLNHSEDWNHAEPHVAVRLHPASLERYLGHWILGALISLGSGLLLALALFGLFIVRRGRKRSSVAA